MSKLVARFHAINFYTTRAKTRNYIILVALLPTAIVFQDCRSLIGKPNVTGIILYVTKYP